MLELLKKILECLESLKGCPSDTCPTLDESTAVITTEGDSLNSVVTYPLTAMGEFKDTTQTVTLTDPTGCLAANPDAPISVRYLVDHEAGPHPTHRLYILIASAGTFTDQSASNSGGTLGGSTINIGYGAADPVANARNDRWVKLTATAADWLAGVSFSTGFMGGVGGAFETLHSVDYEICEGLEGICDGC